ncbi:MAG: hypothetical protein ACI87N_000594 [Flavobacteriales bacterium]|jgi:hypothetical protein
MKTNLLSLAAILSLGFFTSNLEAQTSATVAATTAGAKLIQPMTLSETSPLHFGTINVLTGAGGTVLLPSSNLTRVFSNGVASGVVAPQPTNAAYNVTGTKNVAYALVLPGTITVKESIGNTESMTIDFLKARFKDAGADAITSILSATGTDSFTLGGTLTVKSAQMAGIYAGTFAVSVDYN